MGVFSTPEYSDMLLLPKSDKIEEIHAQVGLSPLTDPCNDLNPGGAYLYVGPLKSLHPRPGRARRLANISYLRCVYKPLTSCLGRDHFKVCCHQYL